MISMKTRASRPRVLIAAISGLLLVPILSVGAFAANGGESQLDGVRAATVAYHDLDAALAAGYGLFYLCTDNEALDAAMGQHFADVSRVLDPTIDALDPEVIVYEPTRDGGYRLVAVEWVVFQADWDALHADAPELFGQTFEPIPAGNRYGLPPFYELHAWIWKGNPRGVYDDWNPSVSCLGNGDPA
jgi:hypothetical protein